MLLAHLALALGISLDPRDLEPRVQEQTQPAHPIQVTPVPGSDSKVERVEITIDGEPFTIWHLTDQPYLHPLLGPSGKELTRAYPFEERAGEPRDHPHHRSLWFAHGAVDGLDFWSGVGPLVRPTGLTGHESGPERGSFEVTDDWIAPDGRVVCRDRRHFEAYVEHDARGLDVDVTLLATEAGLTLGDTKEGTFALRLASGLTVDGSEGRARLTNSEGLQDAAAWGQRARWVLAQGVVDGEPAAVAVMDHPQNLRHPTTWHARTYGLLAANPFGLSEFEGAPKGAGEFHLEPGGALRLRYRVLLFAGVPRAERLDELWTDFASR
jgi:hypothetical protein